MRVETMGSYALFTADDGSELTRGYQALYQQAAAMAQRRANELGCAVELCPETDLQDGEVFEPVEDRS